MTREYDEVLKTLENVHDEALRAAELVEKEYGISHGKTGHAYWKAERALIALQNYEEHLDDIEEAEVYRKKWGDFWMAFVFACLITPCVMIVGSWITVALLEALGVEWMVFGGIATVVFLWTLVKLYKVQQS